MKTKKGPPPGKPKILIKQVKGNKKFVILLNRDSGFCEVTEAITPLELLPFGYHCLPHEGTRKQMERICNHLNRNYKKTKKYTML